MRNFIIFILLFFGFLSSAQNREKAFQINKKLGRGINYGNMFEAPSESAWGNQWQPEYAQMIAGLGFNHVRIPIRWEPADRTSETSPYTITPSFLNRIKQVVDSALANGLYAIINMHHHDALFENPVTEKARFLAQWEQIAAYFKDYPDSLLFELLNEPHNNLTSGLWNEFAPEVLAKIRNESPERVVLIGTAEYGGLGGLQYIEIPDDEYLILTVHYYSPFHFTHQGAEWVGDSSDDWLGTEWNDTETERLAVQTDFAPLKQFEKDHNIPVHIGEFGAYSKAAMKYRVKWTTYISRYLESLNWSWAYWEFSAGFGIYNPGTDTWNTELVDALLHNQMPEPARYVGTPVYTSNFSQTVTDWNLYVQGGASANMLKDGNNLSVTITGGGTENWHVQLVKNNIKLEAGKKYRFTFKAKAATNQMATAYVGKSSSPWSAYSNYNSFSLADTFNTYSYIFDMLTDDNATRIVFDLGKSTTNINIEFVSLEEIVIEEASGAKATGKYSSAIYPNPATGYFIINNLNDFNEFSIINLQGQVLINEQIIPSVNRVNLSGLTPGIYFLSLTSRHIRVTDRFIKK
ncbi:MAG: cellulase family glycosylhydrolase [Bacteroidota bacterium]